MNDDISNIIDNHYRETLINDIAIDLNELEIEALEILKKVIEYMK